MGRRVLVLDSAGMLVGRFPDMQSGHMWSHFRVREPGFTGSVELFDPLSRVSLVVDFEECRSVVWTAAANSSLCSADWLDERRHAGGQVAEQDLVSRRQAFASVCLWPQFGPV